MLTDLKLLEDKLYFPEEIAAFNQVYLLLDRNIQSMR